MASITLSTFLPRWYVLTNHSQWKAVDSTTAQLLEMAFRSASNKVQVSVVVQGWIPKTTAEFDVNAMTWSGMPLRRDAFTNNPEPVQTMYEYWDNDCWMEYSNFERQHFQDCTMYSRFRTTIYPPAGIFDVDLANLMQTGKRSGITRPMKRTGSTQAVAPKIDLIVMEDDESVPEEFKCPILHSPMSIPVVAADGHTYEYSAISKWLVKSSKSPITNEQLPHTYLSVNHALRKIVIEWISANQPDVPVAIGTSKKKMRLSGVKRHLSG